MYFPVDFMAAYKWVPPPPPLLCWLTGKQNYGNHGRNFLFFYIGNWGLCDSGNGDKFAFIYDEAPYLIPNSYVQVNESSTGMCI